MKDILVIVPSLSYSDMLPQMKEWLESVPYDRIIAPDPGYGFAIQKAMKENPNYAIYLVLDSDLAMSAEHIPVMIEYIRCGWDVVVGTRQTREAKVKRTKLRAKVSKVYNKWCSFMFNSELTEHLCGFRAYSGKVVRECILQFCIESHWIWQCETVVIPQIMGFAVTEIPITWVEFRYNRTPIRRLVRDIRQMGIRTFKLWVRWRYYAR